MYNPYSPLSMLWVILIITTALGALYNYIFLYILYQVHATNSIGIGCVLLIVCTWPIMECT